MAEPLTAEDSPIEELGVDFSSDDDDGILFQRAAPQKAKLKGPTPGFQWKDGVILECLELSIAAHDQKEPTIDWQPPSLQATVDLSALSGWEPVPLQPPAEPPVPSGNGDS